MSKLHHNIRNQLQAIMSANEMISLKESNQPHWVTSEIPSTTPETARINNAISNILNLLAKEPRSNTCSLEDPCGEVSGHSLGNHTRCLNCGQQFEKGEPNNG